MKDSVSHGGAIHPRSGGPIPQAEPNSIYLIEPGRFTVSRLLRWGCPPHVSRLIVTCCIRKSVELVNAGWARTDVSQEARERFPFGTNRHAISAVAPVVLARFVRAPLPHRRPAIKGWVRCDRVGRLPICHGCMVARHLLNRKPLAKNILLCSNTAMTRDEAITLLGGNVAKAAQLMNTSPQTIYAWPREGEISRTAADSVQAAIARQNLPPEMLGIKPVARSA